MAKNRFGSVARFAIATGGVVGMLAATASIPAQAAAAAPSRPCKSAQHDISIDFSYPRRVSAQGECIDSGGLWAKVYRNGVLKFEGGNGVGVASIPYVCQGTAVGTFRVVWSTGQTDTEDFPCG